MKWTIKVGLAAIFEFVSPFNRIVVRYKKTDLVLVQMRHEETGNYLLPYELRQYADEFGIEIADSFVEGELDFYLEKSKTFTEVEGWVIRFSDGQIAKIKTQWYVSLHRLLTEDLSREDYIIHATLNGTIDDAVSPLDKGDPMRDYINGISIQVVRYFNETLDKILCLMETYDGNRKTFAIVHRSHRYFSVLMRLVGLSRYEENADKFLKECLIKNTRRLEMAREFLKEELGIDLVKISDDDSL